MFQIFFYHITRYFFIVIFTLYNRLSVRRTEELKKFPKDKNLIVASNHASNLDPILVGVAFPRTLRYLAKEELFRPFIFGNFVRILGGVPVSRADNAASAGAVRVLLRLLTQGSNVVIFPEGSRSEDGKLLPLEGGVGLIAAHSKIDILPVYISGSHEAMPPGAVFVKPAKITVTFGQVLSFPPEFYKGKDAREKIVSMLTDSMRALEAEANRKRAG
ncbi:1-acyl-sn-glycerol-3-phosphate acyltransferase [Synergistales bacterium]|nr:1-acyl-sn-glycerol-3-phosphate acyltransferase [Synergistales bacterium]